jgi:hypothetical protein
MDITATFGPLRFRRAAEMTAQIAPFDRHAVATLGRELVELHRAPSSQVLVIDRRDDSRGAGAAPHPSRLELWLTLDAFEGEPLPLLVLSDAPRAAAARGPLSLCDAFESVRSSPGAESVA